MLNPESLHSDLEQAFVQDDKIAIAKFYHTNFSKTLSYVLKNNGSEQDAKDVYQEAFIVLWRKITDRKLTVSSESNVAGFLYQVAKYKWLDQLGSIRVKHKVEFKEHADLREELELDETYENRLKNVKEALLKLGSQCRELLTLFYYGKKSMNEIGEQLKLNPSSARNQKYRCMKKLKELMVN